VSTLFLPSLTLLSAADHGGNQICPQGFGDLTVEEQQTMVDNDSSLLHCYCDELTYEEQKDVSLLSILHTLQFPDLVLCLLLTCFSLSFPCLDSPG
jgi:hypothetical protein